MRQRTWLAWVLGTAQSIGVLSACSAIVGVHDLPSSDDNASEANETTGDANANDSGTSGTESDLDSSLRSGLQPDVIKVAPGAAHTCALKPDGTVQCWGDNSAGQLGTGITTESMHPTEQDVGILDAVAIASGQRHTCVVHATGHVSCWGDNRNGQLGRDQPSMAPSPHAVPNVSDAVDVAAGDAFTCIIQYLGSVVCWGDGSAGQIGNGSKAQRVPPTTVSSLSNVTALAAGQSHACAVSQGQVFCWGGDASHQLGEDGADSLTPQPVPFITDATSVAATSRSTCALLQNGSVSCWGANDTGQLGTGVASVTPSETPAAVDGVDALEIAAGAEHVCALTRNHQISCWGRGDEGQLGDGNVHNARFQPQASPVNVSGIISTARDIGAGGNHSCAPTNGGAIVCWGENTNGQLGDGTTDNGFSPVGVIGYP